MRSTLWRGDPRAPSAVRALVGARSRTRRFRGPDPRRPRSRPRRRAPRPRRSARSLAWVRPLIDLPASGIPRLGICRLRRQRHARRRVARSRTTRRRWPTRRRLRELVAREGWPTRPIWAAVVEAELGATMALAAMSVPGSPRGRRPPHPGRGAHPPAGRARLARAQVLAGDRPRAADTLECCARRRARSAPGSSCGGPTNWRHGGSRRACRQRADDTRPHRARAAGARAGRGGPQQRPDRRAALHQPQDGERARVGDPAEARRGEPDRGGQARRAASRQPTVRRARRRRPRRASAAAHSPPWPSVTGGRLMNERDHDHRERDDPARRGTRGAIRWPPRPPTGARGRCCRRRRVRSRRARRTPRCRPHRRPAAASRRSRCRRSTGAAAASRATC